MHSIRTQKIYMVSRALFHASRLGALIMMASCLSWGQTWWDGSYQYRKHLTVTAGATAVPSAYSVPVTFDHAALVTAGKSKSNGDDVRILYWTGSAWSQLDRVLDDSSSWNRANTRIWLKTQVGIGASGSDAGYYMYYGYPASGSPPVNGSNVFLFHDTFPGTSLDGTKWLTQAGSPNVSGGVLTLPSTGRILATSLNAFGMDTKWEARVQLGNSPRYAFNFLVGTSDSLGNGFQSSYISFWTDNSTAIADNQAVYPSYTATALSLNTLTSYHNYVINREGSSGVRYFQDSTQVANHTTTVPVVNLRPFLFNDNTGFNMLIDWARVRKYVSPEPTTLLGSEALPIQLSSFAARPAAEGKGVVLVWTTVTETNNYGFTVQRRASNEQNFTELPRSFVAGHGTTLQPQQYSFTDPDVADGQWSYRLKQIDLDGTAHYTDPVQVDVLTDVKEKLLPTLFTLEQNYPNPFNPTTVIQYSLPKSSHVSLKVYNMLGQEVMTLIDQQQEPGTNSVELNASSLASGVYLYKLTAGSFSETKRLTLLR